jgi:hypothetical protein
MLQTFFIHVSNFDQTWNQVLAYALGSLLGFQVHEYQARGFPWTTREPPPKARGAQVGSEDSPPPGLLPIDMPLTHVQCRINDIR